MPLPTLDEDNEYIKAVVYGDPGTGKTTIMASMAKLGKIIHVCAEPGLKRRPLVDLGVPVANIEVYRGDITVDALDALFWDIKGRLDDGEEIVGVNLDSTSEIQMKLLNLTSQKAYEKERASGKPDPKRERFSTFLEDYGTNTGEMRYLIRRFRDLECHVVFSCFQRKDVDKDSGLMIGGPDLTPKLQNDLEGFVDIVCRTRCETVEGQAEPQYWGDFRPKGIWNAKDRWHATPPSLIDPTMDRIIGYVTGELTMDDDPVMQAEKERRKKAKEEKAK